MAESLRPAPAVQMLNISKRYGKSALALDSVSLEVRQGEAFALLGPKGAGKSTVAGILLDLVRPTSGQALVFGHDCRREWKAVRSLAGYLPSDIGVYKRFTPRRVFGLSGELRSMAVDWKRVEALCERLALAMDGPVGELHQADRKKVGLVLALMHRPSLLVLDEPTEGFEPFMRYAVLELLREVRGEGRTVFFTSRAFSEVESICDRAAAIQRGRILSVETAEELRTWRAFRMRVVFQAPPPEGVFDRLPGVAVLHSGPDRAVLAVTGSMDPVAKALAECRVEKFETEPCSLEETFRARFSADEMAPQDVPEARHA